MFTEALQTERDEYGKAVEKSVSHARTRGENLAGVMQSMAAMPVSGAPSFTPEAKESVSKLIEGEMAFYQAFTKSWIDYLAGMEARRSAVAQAMLESNVKMIESGQEVMKSAVKYGEACMEWSLETANGMKSQELFVVNSAEFAFKFQEESQKNMERVQAIVDSFVVNPSDPPMALTPREVVWKRGRPASTAIIPPSGKSPIPRPT